MKNTVLVAVALLLPGPALARQASWSTEHLSSRISRAALDSISDRGRIMAAYDAAAWHGTDAVFALKPREGEIGGYVARQQGDGRWEVVFGRLAVPRDTFLITYRALQDAHSDTAFTARSETTPVPDTGYYLQAMRAQRLALDDFGALTRPYNSIVIPVEGSGEWYVYLVPAPTRYGYWPLGADRRYRISADGRTIIEKRQLHNAIVEYGPDSQSGATRVAGSHSAVVRDGVEDTDVFFVLTRRPALPEYIVSETYFFRVDTDGQITAYDRDDVAK